MWVCACACARIREWVSALPWVSTCTCVWLLHGQTTFQHVSVVAITITRAVPPPWHQTPLLLTVYLIMQIQINLMSPCLPRMYTLSNKNQAAWNFVHPTPEVTRRTVAIIIWVVSLSPYLCIRGTSWSSMHYNQSINQSINVIYIYINQRHQYICLIWS